MMLRRCLTSGSSAGPGSSSFLTIAFSATRLTSLWSTTSSSSSSSSLAMAVCSGRLEAEVWAASWSLLLRFSNMFKAFKFADTDNSGTLTRPEVEHVLELWNVPMDEEELQTLFSKCDKTGDGNISIEEFSNALSR